jgi:CRP/FNR family transcriptional regulator, anaerobic regulatory protein
MALDFIKGINKIFPLSDDQKIAIERYYEIIELPRKTELLRAGQTSDFVYFVINGLVRTYYIKDDEEICSRFMTEQHIVLSVNSFYTRKPGYEFIETVEDCTLARIHYDMLQKIYTEHIEFNYIARVWTEHYCSMSEERLFLLRKQNAKERYMFFLDNYPALLQRLPLKYIASYLGMNMETLSRVRKQISTGV